MIHCLLLLLYISCYSLLTFLLLTEHGDASSCHTTCKLFSENLATQDLKGLGMKQHATLSREEQYEQAVHKSTYLFSTEKRLGLTNSTDRGYLAESVMVPFIFLLLNYLMICI